MNGRPWKLRRWWHWWKALPEHPVYRRESGQWGRPNPFYDKLGRFSPFVVMGAILFGGCAGAGNPAVFSGNDAFLSFWCLICLPGILLTSLTLFGSLMAPALTAPAVSMEMDRGTWDILRTTPLSTRSILAAKLFGALSRLRIWRLLLALSLLQGALMACSATLVSGPLAVWAWLLGLSTLVRPWVEIFFAALAGMFVSTWVRSATLSLAATYGGIVLFRLVNSSLIWLAALTWQESATTSLAVLSSVGPTAVYLAATAALLVGLMRRAAFLEAGAQDV